jgi:type II secretory pathway pseudopilin PulG
VEQQTMKKIFKKKGKGMRSWQSGGTLLEVLVSVLIFALGIAALVGLQARSMATTDDMQHRAEAVHYASAYVGKIWSAAGVTGGGAVMGAQLITQFAGTGGTGGPGYNAFSGQVINGIPGASPPVVRIDPANVTYINRSLTPPAPVILQGVNVAITINWADRQNVDSTGASIIHTYAQTSFVGYNP